MKPKPPPGTKRPVASYTCDNDDDHEGHSETAEQMFWSAVYSEWYCHICFSYGDDDALGIRGISLAEWLEEVKGG